MPERRYKVADVTADSIEGWRDFADRHGMSVAAFAEVIGSLLKDAEMHDLGPAGRRIVEEGRRLTAERRRRTVGQ